MGQRAGGGERAGELGDDRRGGGHGVLDVHADAEAVLTGGVVTEMRLEAVDGERSGGEDRVAGL